MRLDNLINGNTNEREVMWHLRIYGPCSAADLIRSTKFHRAILVAALRRLRMKGVAERCMQARYRLTDRGQALCQQQHEAKRLFPA
jgi:DNA-binding MarR family transcriptional regulator